VTTLSQLSLAEVSATVPVKQLDLVNYTETDMELSDLLAKEGIDPDATLVLRHRPTEPELRKVLPWLAAEKPDVYNAYQQWQSPKVEKQMAQSEYVASFIGHQPGRALFAGIYKHCGHKQVSHQQRSKNKQLRELMSLGSVNGPDPCLWFDLRLTPIFKSWFGKLVIAWPGLEKSFSRWAHSNSRFRIEAIHDESLLHEAIPDWRELVLSKEQLGLLPQSWKAALSQWRGVYSIFDTKVKKLYVGSAYGKDNIYGRWKIYAESGHGGNKHLKALNPSNFQFSILERLSPDTPPDAAIRCEAQWKVRLHTKQFGLNAN